MLRTYLSSTPHFVSHDWISARRNPTLRIRDPDLFAILGSRRIIRIFFVIDSDPSKIRIPVKIRIFIRIWIPDNCRNLYLRNDNNMIILRDVQYFCILGSGFPRDQILERDPIPHNDPIPLRDPILKKIRISTSKI